MDQNLPGLVKVHITNWKDPPFFMGKFTISMVIFNSNLQKTMDRSTILNGTTHYKSTGPWLQVRKLGQPVPGQAKR